MCKIFIRKLIKLSVGHGREYMKGQKLSESD